MNRNAAARDVTGESFAGILEKLTRHSGPETPGPNSSPNSNRDLASVTGSGSKAALASGSAVRSGMRPLMPLSTSQPGRGSTRPESAPLSYEKALQIHSKRANVSEKDVDSAIPRLVSSQHQEMSAEKALPPRPREAFAFSPKTARAIPGPKKKLKTALKTRSKSSSRRAESKSLISPKHHELQLSRIDPAAQRRSVVSVRLTELELAQLRERAFESGISVSAYMRSCVLDTEQLRAQVKQALAEMRGVRPAPASIPQPALSGMQSDGSSNSDWFRLLLRSAAFLLSPLFAFRRSA